jgi:hypothetical protein
MNHAHPLGPVAAQKRADLGFVSYQQHLNIEFLDREQSAEDDLFRRVVPSHRVHGNARAT